MIKNIIFDFGGVIMDLDRDFAVRRFTEIGYENVDKLLGTARQKGIFHELEVGSISRQEFYDKMREMTGNNVTDEQIDSGWFGFVKGVPQARLDYIYSLRSSYNVYLLSNTNPVIVDWAESENFTPAGKPITHYFDKCYYSHSLNALKPDKKIYELLIEDSGIDPHQTLFLDDNADNLRAAEDFGILTLQTTNCVDWYDELEALLANS